LQNRTNNRRFCYGKKVHKGRSSGRGCLIGKGHERIAVIAGNPHSYPTVMRLKGCQKAMDETGLKMPNEYIRYGGWEYDSDYNCTKELLSCEDHPTAIFAMKDLMAAGCINALREAGLRIRFLRSSGM